MSRSRLLGLPADKQAEGRSLRKVLRISLRGGLLGMVWVLGDVVGPVISFSFSFSVSFCFAVSPPRSLASELSHGPLKTRSQETERRKQTHLSNPNPAIPRSPSPTTFLSPPIRSSPPSKQPHIRFSRIITRTISSNKQVFSDHR